MKGLRLRAVAYAFSFGLAVAGVVGAVAAPAFAVGAEVYKTSGGDVVNVGNTSPDCCCAWAANSHVGFGVKVCYLPA